MRSYNRMSNLNFQDRKRLVRLFEAMRLNEHDMREFFRLNVGINIYDEKYEIFYDSGFHFSEFLEQEDDYIVAKATEAMLELFGVDSDILEPYAKNAEKLIDNCKLVVVRLRSSNPITSGNLEDIIRDAPTLVEEIRRIKQSIDTDPDPVLAIERAKNLIESVCKIILSERKKRVEKSPQILPLVKDTLKELKLVPEGAYEEKSGSDAIKTLLNNLGSIGHNLGTLRNLYGGHGKGGEAIGLSARHAKLAAGAASTLALFLIETHEENKTSTNQNAHPS